ncbi:acid ceramidase-like protein [Megavirus lba]|uniref:Acid ceramidase-like protein n=1 Tax=Megavirus lba TaxID=1235314 RepID=L7Y3M5_9VIRU|nr:acid ceramidase-like protein [Megavirus lba]
MDTENKIMTQIQYYDFDLNKSADKIWKDIFYEFKNQIPQFQQELKKIIQPYSHILNLIKLMPNFIRRGNAMYYDEISYISDKMEMDMHEIILLQLIYETTSACTTAVIDVNNDKFYLRTMDWPFDFLKNVTIGLNIMRDNQLIAKAITWLGYIGLLTVTNIEHDYSIAINYRRTINLDLSAIVKNAHRTISMKWPIGYLVRYIIENNFTFSKAKTYFINTELISPCYITMFDKNNSSYIITRNCDKSINVRSDNLIQTNCDFNKSEPNILYSVERREYIRKIIEKIKNTENKISYRKLIKTISKFPIINNDTIYIHYQYDSEFETIINNESDNSE